MNTWHDPAAVPGADAATYQVLNHAWSVDKTRVYFLGKPLRNADRASFSVINELFARDAQRLYCKAGATTSIVDPASFETLDSGCEFDSHGSPRYLGYSRDARKVYYADSRGKAPRVVTGADRDTFRSVGRGFALDHRSVFRHGKRFAGVNPQGFEILNTNYARTVDAVFFGDGKLEGVIPGEFKVIDEYHGRDSKTFFAYGRAEKKSLFSFGGYGVRYKRTSSGSGILKTLGFIVILFAGLLIWLFETLTWWRKPADGEPENKPLGPEATASVRKLAEVLAAGDRKSLAPVLLALDDWPAFVRKYGDRESFDDEPDYAGLIAGIEEDDELPAYAVLSEVFNKRGLSGVIDWRSDTDETRDQVEPMLHRMGVRDFDWSFVDALAEHGDGAELRNNNFLTLLRDRLGAHGLTLAHIDQLGDSYGFAVLRKQDFATIDGLEVEGHFAVRGDFGADEAYERAQKILESQSAKA